MTLPIVPLMIPESHRFEKKSGSHFFRSITQEVLETILENVLHDDHLTQQFRTSLLITCIHNRRR